MLGVLSSRHKGDRLAVVLDSEYVYKGLLTCPQSGAGMAGAQPQVRWDIKICRSPS